MRKDMGTHMENVEKSMKYSKNRDQNTENRIRREKETGFPRRSKESAACRCPGLMGYLAAFFLTVAALALSLSVLENRLVQQEVAAKEIGRAHV